MSFLTGLMIGGSDALASYNQRLDNMRQGLAADRRYREGLAVRESEFSRTLAQADTHHKDRIGQAERQHTDTMGMERKRLNEQTRQFDVTNERLVMQHAEEMDMARTRESGLDRRHGQTLAQADKHFTATDTRLRDQFAKSHELAVTTEKNRVQQWRTENNLSERMHQHKQRHDNTMSQLERQRQQLYQAQINATDAYRKAQLAQQLNIVTSQMEQEESMFNRELAYKYDALSAKGQGSTGSIGNLDTNIFKTIGDFGEKSAYVLHDEIHRGKMFFPWPNRKLSPVQQVDRFESFGKTVAKDVLTLSGGNPMEAIRYAPVFINRMFAADDKKAKNMHEMIKRTVPEGQDRDAWERRLRDAMYRGMASEWGIAASKSATDVAPKTMQIGQPQGVGQALKDWGSYLVDASGAGMRIGRKRIDEFIEFGVASGWDQNRIISEGVKRYAPFELYRQMVIAGYPAEELKNIFGAIKQ